MKKHLIAFLCIICVAALLRLYKLDQNPPALYWDEVSLGYNAYAILTTGHDEHGEFLPRTRFIAFGDYKPPGYIYAIIPFYALFGTAELAVRAPSALAGVLMVILAYFLTYELTRNKITSLIAAALLTISPWSLQLSRAAFEAHLAALFNLAAIYCFVLIKRKKFWLLVAALFFVASFYTFNANRIIAPLLALFLGMVYWRELAQAKKWLVVTLVISGVLLFPYIGYFQTPESKLRFNEVSIFTSLDIVKLANERIERSGNTWWAKIIHNRRVYFAKEFLIHYVDNFKGDFLFISGDRNPRLSTQYIGELYLFELPLILAGIYYLLVKKSKMTWFLLGWLLIAPIPSAMARETPHMLRTASILPTYQIIGALGLVQLMYLIEINRKIIKWGISAGFSALVVFSLTYYFHHFWVHYPREWSGEWQYGYKQMVGEVANMQENYDRIVITESLGRPYIYFLFYNKINPLEYVKNRRADRDWYGLWNVYGFGKYDFTYAPKKESEKVLTVGTAHTFEEKQQFNSVKSPNGETVFEIGEK